MGAKDRVALIVYLYGTLGYRKGTRAAAFIVAWGIYADSLAAGERAHMYGYAGYWGQSQATSYRELQTFHAAFPDDPFPDRVWAKVRDHVRSRGSVSMAAAEALPVVGKWS